MSLLNYLPFSEILTILGAIVLAIFVWAAFSPFETLGWWAGWFGDTIYDYANSPSEEIVEMGQYADSFLIFLSGVGRVSGEPISYREREFLQRLKQSLPHTIIVDDIFPYSVNNLPLTAQPYLGWFWRRVLKSKRNGPKFIGFLINLRNIFQVLVSADRRYGPMFNQGMAEVIMNGLLHHSYKPNIMKPIFLVGYSGAVQIAVGAIPYLKEWINAPMIVISLGGIFSSGPGLLAMDHLYHIVGQSDSGEKSRLVDPRNWPFFITSEWNRALRQGRVTFVQIGPINHTGRGGYMDVKSILPNGTTHLDQTVATITTLVKSDLQLRS